MYKQSREARPTVSDSMVFCRVAEAGSITAAAGALELSRAAVSKYLSRLEARLGVRLLHRSTRRLSLTEAGEAFYRRASYALEELAAAEQAVTEHAGRPRGRLRISAPTFYGTEVLARRLGTFRRRYPEVRLDLEFGNRKVDLVEEQFDLAIRLAAPRDSSLIMRKLAEVPLVTCAAPGYLERYGRPGSPEALSEHDCLVYTGTSRPHEWTYLTLDGERYSVAVSGGIQSDNDHLLRGAALDGLGIVRMPRLFLDDALQAGRLEPLWSDRLEPTIALALLYPSRRELPAKVRAFVEFMTADGGQ